MLKFRPSLAIAVLLVFFISGCVVEKDVSALADERVLSTSARDVDLDNYTDLKTYVFRPIVISAEANITLQKTATAAETGSEIQVIRLRNLSDANVSDIETKTFQFDMDRKEKEDECNQILGFPRGVGCTSPTDCALLCTNSQCRKYGYSSELLGYWIYKYWQDKKSMDDELKTIRDSLVTIQASGDYDRQTIMKRINKVRDLTVAINANPLLNDNMFGVCRPINYDNELLNQMLDVLGEYNRTATTYNYAINLKVVSKNADYTEIKIVDSVPKTMFSSLKDISVPQEGGSYQYTTNTLTWPAIKSSVYSEYIAGYGFVSAQGIREDIFDNWPAPKVTIQVISFTKNPLVAGMIEISMAIYSVAKGLGYYAAIAVIMAFWCIMLLVLWLLLRIMMAGLSTLVSNTKFKENMIATFGKANIYWREYIVAMVVMVIIGVVCNAFATPVGEDVLHVENIVRHLADSIPGALAVIFFFLAIYLIYSLVEDRFKGLIIGKEYFENEMDISPEANLRRLKRLKEALAQLEAALAKAGNLDVSEEKSVLISAPLERIETLVKTKGNEKAAKELLDMYTAKVEAAIVSIEEKSKIFSQYWEEWKAEIAGKLSERDSVPFSALTGIPPEWRVQAVNRYVLEDPDEDLVVNAYGVSRAASTPEKKAEAIIKRLIASDLAIGGAIYGRGGVLYTQSQTGKKSLEAILTWKVSDYAKTLGQRLFNEQCTGIVIVGEKRAAAMIHDNNVEGVVFAKKDKVGAAADELSKKLGRIL